ncbi:MAG TPA: hypothetical protein VFU50_18435 [Terriglobales bacterium]|nr:hypothetical protein [Terriglobales bacterium]
MKKSEVEIENEFQFQLDILAAQRCKLPALALFVEKLSANRAQNELSGARAQTRRQL